MLKRGYAHDEIAHALGRDQSAISREIMRNKVRGIYDPRKAHHKAYVRTHDARWQFSKIHANLDLEHYIIASLKKKRAPEAISGRMKRERKPWYASKTAIYEWLYSVYGQRYCHYLLSRRYGRKRWKGKKQKKWLIPERVSIHARKRMTRKSYEGDTIVSSSNTVSLVTIYNPLVMYLDARKVPNLKPFIVRRAFQSMLNTVRADSLTLDNGQENRLHMKLGIKTYFCDPYSSWQKPGIENGNKLIRRFIPKRSDISQYSHQYLRSIVHHYNHTPRKKLGWMTPYEVMKKYKMFKKRKNR